MSFLVYSDYLDKFNQGIAMIHIRQCVASYDEPSRRGTPKGQPVGLSRRKLLAAMTAALPVTQATRAQLSGVSHALLRKWRTEEAFRLAEQRGRREVAQL